MEDSRNREERQMNQVKAEVKTGRGKDRGKDRGIKILGRGVRILRNQKNQAKTEKTSKDERFKQKRKIQVKTEELSCLKRS